MVVPTKRTVNKGHTVCEQGGGWRGEGGNRGSINRT